MCLFISICFCKVLYIYLQILCSLLLVLCYNMQLNTYHNHLVFLCNYVAYDIKCQSSSSSSSSKSVESAHSLNNLNPSLLVIFLIAFVVRTEPMNVSFYCVGVHRITSLMDSSLLYKQCPVCCVHLEEFMRREVNCRSAGVLLGAVRDCSNQHAASLYNSNQYFLQEFC